MIPYILRPLEQWCRSSFVCWQTAAAALQFAVRACRMLEKAVRAAMAVPVPTMDTPRLKEPSAVMLGKAACTAMLWRSSGSKGSCTLRGTVEACSTDTARLMGSSLSIYSTRHCVERVKRVLVIPLEDRSRSQNIMHIHEATAGIQDCKLHMPLRGSMHALLADKLQSDDTNNSAPTALREVIGAE